jgi:3-methyladenine DNA glycosylase AlkD
MDIPALLAEIDAELAGQGDARRAEQEKAYLRSELHHFGTRVPAVRAVAKSVGARYPGLGHDDLVALVDGLWAVAVHERRMAAAELLSLHPDLVHGQDAPLLERLLREARTWALVDGLAASVAGPLFERCPGLGPVLDRWAVDEDFWLRRSALLALLLALRRGGGDFPRFSRYADLMLDEKEFFIRKAIGWVLRDTARKRPVLVYEWLLPRAPRLSGVTVREAVKPLSERQREAVLAAR